VNGEEDDFGSVNLADPGGRPDAIHAREIDVEQDDIRLQLTDFGDSLFAIPGLAADLKGIQMQQRANGATGGGIIVNNKYAGRQSALQASESLVRRRGGSSAAGFYNPRLSFVTSIRVRP